MPSAATALNAIAFEQLLARNGEAVALKRGNGATETGILALVNRIGPPPQLNASADGGEKTGAIIQFLSTLTKPNPGEVVTDDQGHKHRITETEFLGHAWQCKCTSRNAS